MHPNRNTGIPAPNQDWVLEDLSGLLAPAEPPDSGGEGVRGFYINLDHSTDRRAAMEAQLAAPGFAGRYQRFAALPGDPEEARGRGLRTAGELGVWRSTLAVLERISAAGEPQPIFWHVLEDDVELHPMLPQWLESLAVRASMDWDVLFTDSYVIAPMYQQGLALCRDRDTIEDLRLVKAPFYLAGLTSYLMRPKGARRLFGALHGVFHSGERLAPIDLVIRRLGLDSVLDLAVCLPFLTKPGLAFESTVQDEVNRVDLRQRSVASDLYLRRLLYFESLQGSGDLDDQAFWRHLESDYSCDERRELIPLILDMLLERGYKLLY